MKYLAKVIKTNCLPGTSKQLIFCVLVTANIKQGKLVRISLAQLSNVDPA